VQNKYVGLPYCGAEMNAGYLFMLPAGESWYGNATDRRMYARLIYTFC